MTEDTAPRGEGETEEGGGMSVLLAAALSPADANAARQRLIAALDLARASGEPLAVEIDGTEPWPCALQLLAAAERSAEAAGVPFAPGPRAAGMRLPLSRPDET